MSAIGVIIRLKYGVPTETRSSLIASMSKGNTVPSSTTNANTANNTLLPRNAASRDSGESIRPGARRRSPRQPIRPTVTTIASVKNARIDGPIALSVNA